VSAAKRSASADAPADPADAAPSADDLAGHLAVEIAGLDRELAEIEMLVAQAQTESGRHEQKRAQTAEKLTGVNLPPDDITALNAQLLTLTKRAAVMQAQVDVLEGKRKTLQRFRTSLGELAERFGGLTGDGVARIPASSGGRDSDSSAIAPMSRIVLNAQEDLRREIARAMHDGPAQSLTNIVLQAQIVERLVGRDPEGARGEVRLLTRMVQHTLDATKTFIFDVRPMVLDDLGLVPTLRRAARERGRRAGIPVEFDSIGQDRRIDVDQESSLFRILDEALSGYLSVRPDRVALRLDWLEDRVEARVTAERDPTAAMADADRQVADVAKASEDQKDLPPALESMMADRRAHAEEAVAAARAAAVVALPSSTWREIQQRAVTTGIFAELSETGGTLLLRADLEPAASDAGDAG
jgi:two-component system, NarL family, sensor histidine kinase DegS